VAWVKDRARVARGHVGRADGHIVDRNRPRGGDCNRPARRRAFHSRDILAGRPCGPSRDYELAVWPGFVVAAAVRLQSGGMRARAPGSSSAGTRECGHGMRLRTRPWRHVVPGVRLIAARCGSGPTGWRQRRKWLDGGRLRSRGRGRDSSSAGPRDCGHGTRLRTRPWRHVVPGVRLMAARCGCGPTGWATAAEVARRGSVAVSWSGARFEFGRTPRCGRGTRRRTLPRVSA
jgi:hypothetical protein